VIKVSVKHFIPGIGDEGNVVLLAIAIAVVTASVATVVILILRKRKRTAKQREQLKHYLRESDVPTKRPEEIALRHPLAEDVPPKQDKTLSPPEAKLTSVQDKLWQLRSLKEKGLISEGEYEEKSKELLKRL
jgi:hypothetical protein